MKPRDPERLNKRVGRINRQPPLRLAIVAITLGAASMVAHAELADRDQPVNIEADRVEIDDKKKEAVFEGNVVLTQGTLMLKADRIIVDQDETGFQSGIAFGSPAYFRQKREGFEDFIEGEAERLEYKGKEEKVELFVNAKLKRGGDEVRGNYISYSALTEFFEVMGKEPGSAADGSSGGRVRAIIQPRNSNAGDPQTPDGNNKGSDR